MIEATKALATTAELMGTVREVYGYSYDPMIIIESPFIFSPRSKNATGGYGGSAQSKISFIPVPLTVQFANGKLPRLFLHQ